MSDKPYTGKSNIRYKTGDTYVGDVVNDERHGQGIFKYSTGGIYDGEWKRNNRDGKGKMVYSTGGIYDGDWKDEKRDGKGKMIYSNGDIYEGEFLNGKKHGNGVLTEKNGKKNEGYFEDDNLLYKFLKITKSALNKCADVFSLEELADRDIITLHNQKIDMFDVNTTINEEKLARNICPYIFSKDGFDKYIEKENRNPTTREPITKDNYKSYMLRIIDDINSKSPAKSPKLRSRSRSKSKSKSKSRSPAARARSRSMSKGGKRTRRR